MSIIDNLKAGDLVLHHLYGDVGLVTEISEDEYDQHPIKVEFIDYDRTFTKNGNLLHDDNTKADIVKISKYETKFKATKVGNGTIKYRGFIFISKGNNIKDIVYCLNIDNHFNKIYDRLVAESSYVHTYSKILNKETFISVYKNKTLYANIKPPSSSCRVNLGGDFVKIIDMMDNIKHNIL